MRLDRILLSTLAVITLLVTTTAARGSRDDKPKAKPFV
jgi:hypothetical protein